MMIVDILQKRLGYLVCSLLICTGAVHAGDWAGFRGTRGDGIARNETVPLTWDSQTNVKWRIPMPRPANGSPIVVGNRVFYTSAEDKAGKKRTLYCVNTEDGAKIWSRTVNFGRKMPAHETNLYGGSTPACDGKRVVVWHGSAGLYCYDMDGKELWNLKLGDFRHAWGYGTSPVIDGDQVILLTGPGKVPFIAAYDIKTGAERWKIIETKPGKGNRKPGSVFYGSWSTPIVIDVGKKRLLIVNMPTRVVGIDPKTGKEIWSCDGLNHAKGDLVYSSPIIAGNLCFVTGGFFGPSMAIDIRKVAPNRRKWRISRNSQCIGTGLHVDGYVYRSNSSPGSIECIDPKTGKTFWKDPAGKKDFWGSMVRVGKHLMITNRQGVTYVFIPSAKKFDLVSKNDLADVCSTTPAISNGCIYIRTSRYLYCIGEK